MNPSDSVSPTLLLTSSHWNRILIIAITTFLQLILTIILSIVLKRRSKKTKIGYKIVILSSFSLAVISYILMIYYINMMNYSCYWNTGFLCMNPYILNILIAFLPILFLKKDIK
jgi:ABC-type sugar transport system permease subunit